MNAFFTIWKRELAACFLSPIAYVLLVVFLAVASGTFLAEVFYSGSHPDPIPVVLFEAVLVWMTILITVVCMRLFAEEKRSGTIETLMTVPVTETEVVLGKFAGAFSFLVLLVLPVVGVLFILIGMSPGLQLADLDGGALLSGGLLLTLLTGCCVAVGLCVSLLTRNQIVAALCSFCTVWLLLLLGWMLATVPFGWSGIADYVAATDHLRSFANGAVDTRPIVLYASTTVFLLFVSIRLLESRRWRT